MRITSHASCGPIVHIQPDGTVLLSRMEYTKNGHTSIRHIMESGKNGQTVLGTLTDGVVKEGAKDPANFHPQVLSAEPIYIEFVKDQYHGGGHQMKVVFPVFVEEHELRDFEKPDDDDPDEVHGGIFLKKAEALIIETEKRTVPFHYNATRAALRWAALQKESVYNRYGATAVSWEGNKLTPEQLEAIKEYRCRW